EKGDIFHKRTIVKAKVIDRVDTSLEALVLSVSQKAKVDLDYMSSLTGKGKNELVDELRGEIFLNIAEYDAFTNRLPFQNARNEDNFRFSYVTSDEYLSGNIREKLGIIDEYIRNTHKELRQNAYYQGDRRIELSDDERESLERELVELEWQREKLKEVLPKELTASEINVRLGATWIPTKDIERFIFETLKTPAYNRWDIKVKFSEQTSEWNIEGKSKDYGNDLANMTYGTSRVNAYKLIEDALNLKETKVFDQIENPDGTKKSVLNKKETLLAGQKQELLKEEFKNFIFEEPERRSRLEKLYNERFNSIRNREYNGENLSFEGMNAEITLREHQRNAIARSLYGGNTLLAHVVGSGKTYEMVASAMESKRLGLCSKSLFVVPNHLTGQIGREFMQLYPGANIMVADKKDFEPKNRKRFIGRIATGEYDAVVIGHTQFEKIPMSKEYQEKHIADQIDEIVNYINEYKHDRNQNFTVKQLEKTRKKLEARLEKLNDDFKKDDVITFEELGVDKLFVDEAHSYKNLYLYTKMRNIAGIGQSEAIKSSDMYMKCRYMDEITGGKGIVFATGTPISNSMTELYTMQRYLQYDELKKMGLENFDSWAANFGETVSAFELSPEGTGYRVKTRFSKFFNIPELMSMFKEVADIQTADMLDLPTPNAHYEVIKTMPSEEQKEVLASLATRADDVRERRVEPEEDNMLKITNDGKKLALDQRLINPLLPDDPNSKVNVCVKNIFAIWDKTTDKRSTQLVFSDMSTPKGDGEFNIYDDIRDKLVNMGVPKEEIAFIHEANTDKQKDDLFAKVRRGEVRILLGSTQKMGAGTNVQNKLIALHDLDVPWRPSDLEQRAGRIVRQGNENSDVNIFRYVTENTFDAYLWQTIENKQKFISQIMTSKTPARVAEDVDESSLNYAEIKALATGNPLIKEKMDLDNEVVKLKMLESNYKSNRYRLEDKVVKSYPEEIKRLETLIEAVREDIRT
ncbi:MAG: DEAD/DEAH box helicase family protein, partial [Syntrophomonadaceae bacterium]|nr:DEAD/DEAH box helicase family protein [Syntrophomonadaceae bacterium]